MCEVLRLERLVESTPWGFRVTGGYDFGTPLSVVKVTGGSIAANNGVKVGDIIVEINGQSTKHFIHTDAQNFIGISGNHLTLTILRGSLVTPPVTPLRGRTPMIENEDESRTQIEFNAHLLHDRLESTIKAENQDENYDDLLDAPIVHENIGMKPDVTKSIQRRYEDEEITQDVSEIELDELLTGNEEVLDEGVLGINFKKYLPKVDFIRQSEVFKFLQNENIKKEIPEQVQLEKEPTKRFSTFLQKPKPPPAKPQGPLWHYPKAPRYLPREANKDPEQPRRRLKRDSCHTVLWLFLGESGEHVVDERWGSAEEERINISRCEMREEDTMSVTSSLATGQSGRESQLDKLDETGLNVQNTETSEQKFQEMGNHMDNKELVSNTVQNIEHNEMQMSEVESKLENNKTEEITEEQSSKFISEEIAQVDKMNSEQQSASTINSKKQVDKESVSKQIADIQAQISALEIQASTDLQTQLLAIQEQLSKIVDVKSGHVTTSRGEKFDVHTERKEYYKDERTRVEEEEKCLAEQSENYYEYTFECEAKIDGKDSYDEHHESSQRCSSSSESENKKYDSYGNREESLSNKDESEGNYEIEVNDERIESFEVIHRERTRVEEEEKCLAEQSENYYEYTFECEAKIDGKDSYDEHHESSQRCSSSSESENKKYDSYGNREESQSNKDESEGNYEIEVNDERIESFERGEYEICEAPSLQLTRDRKSTFHPITPQMRPIVLPGGRMWRQPKDACHDDFYQGVLVAQAEVMVGNTGGVNFTKYVPPKFDMSHSAVYKLVHEIEDKTRAIKEKEKESPYYHTPIGKRHFYAATLKEPDPVGGVDLQL